MMIRTKRGMNMKDKPFRLVSVRLMDARQRAYIQEAHVAGRMGQRWRINLEEIYDIASALI
ncbi:MAG: hypothetical protein H6559_27645 [Lewinellaceae bacterium]|nr:hypothetical protein [Lewinellaceae bacterium]